MQQKKFGQLLFSVCQQFSLLIVILSFITVSGSAQSWVEIAFGTRSGVVRVIVQHPENVGQGLQVFRTFVAHTSPVIKVVLGEKHLITGTIVITPLQL